MVTKRKKPTPKRSPASHRVGEFHFHIHPGVEAHFEKVGSLARLHTKAVGTTVEGPKLDLNRLTLELRTSDLKEVVERAKALARCVSIITTRGGRLVEITQPLENAIVALVDAVDALDWRKP